MNDEIAKLRGLKKREMEGLGRCPICRQPHVAGGLTFYRVRIDRGGFLLDAMNRQAGLQAFMGNVALADAMGPDEDMAKLLTDPVEVLVHEHCAGKVRHLLELMGDATATQAKAEGGR